MKASGAISFGLVKTVSPRNEQYCDKSTCTYYVTLYYTNLKSLSFFPSVMPNNSEISFHKNFKLLEELEPYEVVSYVLKVPAEYHG